jgi:porin
MFLKADVQPSIAESKAATAEHRSAVDLKLFCGLSPLGFRWLGLMAVSICCSLRYVCAQSMHNERSTPSVEGPSHTYLSASPSPDAVSAPSLAMQYALGSWGGIRSELGRRGVVPTLILISDPFGNLHGGERTGAAAYNLVGLDFRIDTGRLIGWKGGQFDIGGAVNFGTSLSRSYIGNSFQVQLADCAGTQPRLTYLSYTQTLQEDRMSFRVGRLTLNSVYGEEFMGSEYFKSFTSIGFDLIPEGVFFNVSGAAGYPRTTWGTRLRYSPTKRFYAQAGGYNADTQPLGGSHHGIDFSIRGPLFAIGEVGFRRFAQADDDSRPIRNIKAGGFYTGGTHYNVSSGVLNPVRGLYGFYALGDQQIWRLKLPSGTPRAEAELSQWGDAERQRHVGAFASVVVIPEPRTNVMPYFFNVGAMSYGLSPQRPRDFFGLGFVYGSNSRGPVLIPPVLSTEHIPLLVPPNEQTLELTYGFALRPGVLLQPSLQYIVHPRGIASIPNALPQGATVPNALALGVNTVISF